MSEWRDHHYARWTRLDGVRISRVNRAIERAETRAAKATQERAELGIADDAGERIMELMQKATVDE
jgi:hypothetical protein